MSQKKLYIDSSGVNNYCVSIRYTTKYNRIETKKIGYMFDPNPFTGVVDIDIIEPTEYHDFDGIRIRFPGKIDEYLKLRYGNNYMELPPKDRTIRRMN